MDFHTNLQGNLVISPKNHREEVVLGHIRVIFPTTFVSYSAEGQVEVKPEKLQKIVEKLASFNLISLEQLNKSAILRAL